MKVIHVYSSFICIHFYHTGEIKSFGSTLTRNTTNEKIKKKKKKKEVKQTLTQILELTSIQQQGCPRVIDKMQFVSNTITQTMKLPDCFQE